MKTQITKVSVLQTSKVMALVAPVFGLFHSGIGLILIIIATGLMANGQSEGAGLLVPGVILLLMPVLMFFMTFIFTALGALLYNWVASKVGGIEFQTTVVAAAALDDPVPDSLP
ncbi:MAG: hypothetical protein VX346_17680 [Planctomycetota bacterium]|nr:hypothetical protein [Planctomycetota bacterium]